MSSSYSYQESTSYSSGGNGGASAQFGGASHGSGQLLGASYQETSYSSSSGNRGASGLGFAAEGASSGAHFSSSASGSASGASNQAVSQIAQDLLQYNQGRRASGASGAAFNASGASGASFGASGASHSSHASQSGSASFHQQSSSASFNASSSASGSGAFLSAIEQQILRSTVPIEVSETENLTVSFKGQQETGVWANRQEVINWKGVIPITEYIINEDMNPEVITKRTEQQLVYIQELAIRYLRPPTPPAPGEILITQEMNTLTPPAPPLVIRQMPARAATPEPLVIREAPPQPPAAVGRKVITISGKRIPPAPRKVVIERLAPLPSKPQSVLVERWLPYSQVKRRVIFQRSNERDAVVVKPRNVIVQWEAPQVVIKKEFKYLGVIRANPVEYVQRYGATLKVARELPDFVLDIKTPDGLVLAADYQYNAVHELEGDVKALGFVDLDREGLSEYRALLAKLGITYVGAAGVVAAASQYQSSGSFAASSGSAGASFGSSSAQFGASGSGSAQFGASGSAQFGSSGSAQFGASGSHGSSSFSSHSASGSASASSAAIVEEIFNSIDRDHNGQITIEEAARVLLKLNSRLGRRYGEDESRAFFQALDVDHNDKLSLEEFRAAFVRLL